MEAEGADDRFSADGGSISSNYVGKFSTSELLRSITDADSSK